MNRNYGFDGESPFESVAMNDCTASPPNNVKDEVVQPDPPLAPPMSIAVACPRPNFIYLRADCTSQLLTFHVSPRSLNNPTGSKARPLVVAEAHRVYLPAAHS